jgi:hypothetical protein
MAVQIDSLAAFLASKPAPAVSLTTAVYSRSIAACSACFLPLLRSLEGQTLISRNAEEKMVQRLLLVGDLCATTERHARDLQTPLHLVSWRIKGSLITSCSNCIDEDVVSCLLACLLACLLVDMRQYYTCCIARIVVLLDCR